MTERLSTLVLARRYGLAADAGERLDALLRLVVADPAAPTTVTTPAGVLRDHLADSLVALSIESVRDSVAIADIGAGAGFPGLPLAVALPNARVSLVEANRRKCGFIARAAEACAAVNAEVVNARAEEWTAGLGGCDLVVVRAVAALPVVAEYAAPLLHLDGTLVAWRGRRNSDDERRGARAARILGLEPAEPTPVTPYAGAHHRYLHSMRKVAPTPDGYPRRPGIARKRPLG